jgi:polysaccharide biosynthesis transport protein
MANEALRLIGTSFRPTEWKTPAVPFDLRAIWQAILRRRWVIVGTVAGATVLVNGFASTLPPSYKAEALVQVNNRESRVVDINNVVPELIADDATMQTEVQFLGSREFLARVTDRLDLIEDPEFNLNEESTRRSLLTLLNPFQYLPSIFRAYQRNEDDSLAREQIEKVEVTDALRDHVTISQVGSSYVVAVDVSSRSASKAERIANGIAEEYLAAQLERKYAAAARATDWLEQRIGALRGQVLEAEAQIVEYRSNNHIVETEGSNPVTMQLTQLHTQLALSQAERAEAEARLTQVRSMVQGQGGVQAAALVLSSPMMAELRSQEIAIMRRISELSSELGDRHPQMIAQRSDLQSIRQKMQDEVSRLTRDLENQIAVAQAREGEIQRSLDEAEKDATNLDMAGVNLRNLQRDADANRELFQTFLTRFQEIVEQQELQEADARIISYAVAPVEPYAPRIALFTIAAFGSSLILAGLLVFVIETWQAGYAFRSADEILPAVGVPSLALVPAVDPRDLQGTPVEEYVLRKPASAFAEALQRIRSGLVLAQGERPLRTVLITSSVPLEGKSTLAAALARQSARVGLRVMLIDADLRRPRLHEVLGVPNQNGLSDVLSGRVDPMEAVRRDAESGLEFMPAGVPVISPPDLLRTPTMRILLEEMSEYYDLVIIDSPPMAVASDSSTLSSLVDASIYVVRWANTPRRMVLSGISQLVDAGGDVAGVVLSRVDVNKHAGYDYADSGYYQSSYSKYYVN